MHTRSHAYTFVDFLMLMVKSLGSRDDAKCVKSTHSAARHVTFVPLQSTAHLCCRTLLPVDSKSSERVACMLMVHIETVSTSPAAQQPRESVRRGCIKVSPRSRDLCLSPCERCKIFLHTLLGSGSKFDFAPYIFKRRQKLRN